MVPYGIKMPMSVDGMPGPVYRVAFANSGHMVANTVLSVRLVNDRFNRVAYDAPLIKGKVRLGHVGNARDTPRLDSEYQSAHTLSPTSINAVHSSCAPTVAHITTAPSQ
jgi:hypothetical protein